MFDVNGVDYNNDSFCLAFGNNIFLVFIISSAEPKILHLLSIHSLCGRLG